MLERLAFGYTVSNGGENHVNADLPMRHDFRGEPNFPRLIAAHQFRRTSTTWMSLVDPKN
jgi:hypothetical protein